MRILICSLEAPLPPSNGLRVHVSALVRELQKEHEVRVLALHKLDQDDPGNLDWLRLVPDKIEGRPVMRMLSWETALFVGRAPVATESAGQLRRPLLDELRRFQPEVVHVTSGRLARLGASLRGQPKVLAALDAWHLNVDAEIVAARGAIRRLRRIERRLVTRFERSEYRRFERVVVVSEEDRQALLAVNAELTIEVIPNGVDADAFDWDGTSRDRSLIVFTGVMSYAPNVTAAEVLARDVLPRVRRLLPSARLALVGRDPAPEVWALGDLPGVEVVGEVPDLRPRLSRAGAYACPMLTGTGIKNKLLEAMANGLPCVASPLALRGLHVTNGEQVLVGSDPDELAAHLVSVLGEEGRARGLGDAGRSYVRAHHSWASVAEQFVRVYRDVASIDGNRAQS
ncbi:MAG: glycosyltransferase family 4 protein [Actinomycetota bacterium]